MLSVLLDRIKYLFCFGKNLSSVIVGIRFGSVVQEGDSETILDGLE